MSNTAFPTPSNISAASKVEMEGASLTTVYSSPGRQQSHPGHPKAWCAFNSSSGAPVLGESYNVTSITDGGTGTYTVNYTTAFTGSAPCATVSAGNLTGGGRVCTTIITESSTTTLWEIYQVTGSPGNSDAQYNNLAAWGDQ